MQKMRPNVLTLHDHAFRYFRLMPPSWLGWVAHSLYAIHRAQEVTTVANYISRFADRVRLRPGASTVYNILPKELQTGQDVADGHDPASLISIGNWSRIKNLKTALAAFARVRKSMPEAHYHLVGPGLDEASEACVWAKRHNFHEGVIWHGKLPYRECLRLISRSGLLLSASLIEGYPGNVTEAICLKVPVIATWQDTGSRELLKDGVFGTMTDGRSPDAIAQSILEVLHKTSNSERLAGARDHVLNLSDPKKILEAYSRKYARAQQGFFKDMSPRKSPLSI
jgi:glycosyltransferase involved in cell wall biosynthesis